MPGTVRAFLHCTSLFPTPGSGITTSDHPTPGKININPGPGHVGDQDDWINPDTSKLPPVSTIPTTDHAVTREEARNVPVALGMVVGGASALDPEPITRVAGTVAGSMLTTEAAQDIAEKALSGRIIQIPDPEASHLENQKLGYTD